MNCDGHFGSHPPYLHLTTSDRGLLLAFEGYRNRASLSSVILGNHHEALLSHGRDEVRSWQLGRKNVSDLGGSIVSVVIYDYQGLASSSSAWEQLIDIASAHGNASHVTSNYVWLYGAVNWGLAINPAVWIEEVIYLVDAILVVSVFPILLCPGFWVGAGYGKNQSLPRNFARVRISHIDRARGGSQHGGDGNI